MKMQRHINYYEALLLAGFKVTGKLSMTAGTEKAKGRMWEASARLSRKGFDVYLQANFHGGLAETEETAKANLNVARVRMYVEGGKAPDHIDFPRSGLKAIMLSDGIYIMPEKNPDALIEARKMITYNTNLYSGIPEDGELTVLKGLGYKKVIDL